MSSNSRRDFLRKFGAAAGVGVAASVFPPAIQKALAAGPHRHKGTIEDVKHVVILMQENRSFDHYFGTLAGVRGFGDRLPVPAPDAPGMVNRTVWYQPSETGTPSVVAPFHLDTEETFALMRVEGTPHAWPDAQGAWGQGQLKEWPKYKRNHSMGYFTEQDMPFQFALAEAFTICDGYHCSFMQHEPEPPLPLDRYERSATAGRRPGDLQPIRQRRLRLRGRLHVAHVLRAPAGGGHHLADLPEHGRQFHRQLGRGLPQLPRLVLR